MSWRAHDARSAYKWCSACKRCSAYRWCCCRKRRVEILQNTVRGFWQSYNCRCGRGCMRSRRHSRWRPSLCAGARDSTILGSVGHYQRRRRLLRQIRRDPHRRRRLSRLRRRCPARKWRRRCPSDLCRPTLARRCMPGRLRNYSGRVRCLRCVRCCLRWRGGLRCRWRL